MDIFHIKIDFQTRTHSEEPLVKKIVSGKPNISWLKARRR